MHGPYLRTLVLFLFLSAVCGGMAGAAPSKDERNLEREAKRLNDTAAKPDGEKAVMKELSATFKTGEPAIQALRDRKLGYGEIAVILSLAQTLPGGATDANVQKVMALRQGPPAMGWGQVARQLNVKLGKTVSQVKKLSNKANREIKSDHAHAGRPAPAAQQQEPRKEKKAEDAPSVHQSNGRSLNRGKAN